MALEVLVDEQLAAEAGEHQPLRRTRTARPARACAPPRSSRRSPAGRRARPAAVGAADLDHAPVVVEVGRAGGEVDPHRAAAAGAPGRDGRRDRRRHVDHEHVAGREQLGQVAERPVLDRPLRAARDEQPHAVAGDAPRLGRLVGLEVGLRARTRARSSQRDRRRDELAGPVAAARQLALDQREQARDARPRAAGGRRCPRRGTPPGASGCACRRGRPSRSAAPGARRPGSRSAGRARPSRIRSRPSPRTARPRRRS